MTERVYLRAMVGIGDNLYARPFVRDIVAQGHEVSLMTPFPQLYSDFRLRIVRPQTSLDYAMKNVREWGEENDWRGAPRVEYGGEKLVPQFLSYDPEDRTPVIEQMEAKFPLRGKFRFDLPPVEPSELIKGLGKKIAVIRPVVIREGFGNPARNVYPEYIHRANEALMQAGFRTVSIANLGPGEKLVGESVASTFTADNGELSFVQIMELFKRASVVVSGPGFAMPMAIAARKPYLLALWGARKPLDNPHRIFDHRMNLSKVVNFEPNNLCDHFTGECDCSKAISYFQSRLCAFVDMVRAETC